MRHFIKAGVESGAMVAAYFIWGWLGVVFTGLLLWHSNINAQE